MSDINALFDQLDAFKLPPIDKWHPDKIVDIDIKIAFDGRWYYQGGVIGRHRIVKLFSTVIRLEHHSYYLVTPPVKYKIQVEDVPFVAVELNRKGEGVDQELFFRTNMDEVVLAGAQNLITMSQSLHGDTVPYLDVRDGLKARIGRSVYYELAELVQHKKHLQGKAKNKDNIYGVYSNKEFFAMGSIE